MASKVFPELRLLFYNRSSVTRPARHVITLVHDYSTIMRQGTDAAAVVPDRDPSVAAGFSGVPHITETGPELDFCRFTSDGRVLFGASAQSSSGSGTVAGWILKARDGWMDAKIQGDESLTSGLFQQTWVASGGTFSPTWNTVIQRSNPARCCLMNSNDQVGIGTIYDRVETVGAISANRGMTFDVTCIGRLTTNSPVPAVIIEMPQSTYRVVLRHNQIPTVDSGGPGWTTIMRLKDAGPSNLINGHYRVSIRRLNGMLVVGIDEKFFYQLETVHALRSDAPPQPREVGWPSGKLSIRVYGIRVVIATAMVKYATAADEPYSGSFTASQKFTTTPPTPASPFRPHGCVPEGCAVDATGSNSTRYLNYSTTLTANDEGIDTPLVTKTTNHLSATWTAGAAATPLNVSAAVLSLSLNAAMPPAMPGADATVELDRTLLTKIDAAWESTVQDYAPVEVMARWKLSDGTYDPPTGYYSLLQGYVARMQKSTAGPLMNTVSVQLRDPVFRLQGENARIDGRYPPADLHFLNSGSTRFYGKDAVKEILRVGLGPTVAASLYSGIGTTFPTNHYPLLSKSQAREAGLLTLTAALEGSPVVLNKPWFPPPFGDDALGWIQKFMDFDRAVFFSGYPTGDTTTWAVPIYGQIPVMFPQPTSLSDPSIVEIPDSDYISGDANKVLQSATNESRPDRNINRVLAWGKVPAGTAEAFFPSMAQGEARVPTTDPNAPELSWERTLVVRDPLMIYPGAARDFANRIIYEIAGRLARFPAINIRGSGHIGWGMDVKFNMVDTGLGLSGIAWRVERISHSFTDMSSRPDWKTTLNIRRLSTSGY